MKHHVRKIVIGDNVWAYRIGKSNVTARCQNTGERKSIDFSTQTGYQTPTPTEL